MFVCGAFGLGEHYSAAGSQRKSREMTEEVCGDGDSLLAFETSPIVWSYGKIHIRLQLKKRGLFVNIQDGCRAADRGDFVVYGKIEAVVNPQRRLGGIFADSNERFLSVSNLAEYTIPSI